MSASKKKHGAARAKDGQRPASSGKGGQRTAAQPPLTPYERVAWVCLHLLVILVPLGISNLTALGYSFPWTFDQFDIVKVFIMRGLMLVAVAAWALGVLLRGGRIRLHKLLILVGVFFGWLVLTTATSIHWQTAVFGKYRRYEGLISFITYAAVLWVALQLIDRPSRIRSLSWSLVISGALVSTYGLIQVVGLDPTTWGSLPFESNRAFSTYGNPDLLGGYLVFPFLIALALTLSERVPWRRIAGWAMVFLLTGAGLTAYVRGAWIGATVGLIILLVVWVRSRSKEAADSVDEALRVINYVALGLIGVLVVAVVVVSLGSGSAVTNILKRIVSIFEFGEGSAKTRFQIWEAAIAAVKERPVFGWGLDTFRLLFPKFKPLAYTATAGYLSVADNVHNYPLQIASAIGIPGFLMLYGVFGWTLVASFKDAFARGVRGERLLYAAYWAAIVAYLVHLLFGLSVTGSTVFLWLSVAVVLTPLARTVEIPSGRDVAWRPIVAALVVGTCAVGAVANCVYIAADHDYLVGRLGIGGQYIEGIQRAIDRNPFNDMYRMQLGQAYISLFTTAMSNARDLQQQGQDASSAVNAAQMYFVSAEDALLSAIEFVPDEYDTYVFITSLYVNGGIYFDQTYYQDAVEWGLRGVAIEPYGPAIRVQLARAYWGVRDWEAALEQAELAASMDPDYVEPLLIAGDLYMRLERYAEARDAYQRVLDYNPDDASALSGVLAAEEALAGKGTVVPPSGEQTTTGSDEETNQ